MQDFDMIVDSSASATHAQPVKEAGRGVGSAEKDTVISNTVTINDPTIPHPHKRQRSSNDNTSPLTSSSPLVPVSPVDLPSITTGNTAAATSLITSSMALPPDQPPINTSTTHNAALPNNLGTYVRLHVGSNKLRDVADIDNRSMTALQVLFKVDKFCPSPPIIDAMQYKYNEHTKRKLAAAFTGGNNGFGIVSPIILTQKTSPTTEQQCIPEQKLWVAELTRQMKESNGILCDEGTNVDTKVKVCTALWKHIDLLKFDGGNKQPALWNRDLLTSTWDQVLALRTNISSNTSPRTPPAQNQRYNADAHTYTLTLHTATPETAFIVACAIASFSLMRFCHPPVTAEWDKKLNACCKRHEDATDSSDSSDDNNDFTVSRKERRRIKHTQKYTREVPKKQTQLFLNSKENDCSNEELQRYNIDSSPRFVIDGDVMDDDEVTGIEYDCCMGIYCPIVIGSCAVNCCIICDTRLDVAAITCCWTIVAIVELNDCN
jgi:hypothetical protein